MVDDDDAPVNDYDVVIRFKWTEDEFTFNDGADDDLSHYTEDPIGHCIDAYLALVDDPGSFDRPFKWEVVSAIVNTKRNSEEKETFLRNTLLGED